MKKLILYILLILPATGAFAQKDAQAKVILNQVSQKYKSFNFIKSDFTFTVDNQQAGVKETHNGTLITQSKTNKYRVAIYADANAKPEVDQEIINDGKSQWTYNKKDKEVQVSDADHSSDSFNPAQLFTLYERGYKYLYTGEQKIGGKVYQVIDLSPEDDKKQFFKIRLTIDKVKKQIYSALIFDTNGSKYNYTLRSFITSADVPANTFTFDAKAHPGVEVVDLR
jgi:outer membrane lipoprotein-sorting protein